MHVPTLLCSSLVERETVDGAVRRVTRCLSGVVRDGTEVRRVTFGAMLTSSFLITVGIVFVFGSLEPPSEFRYEVNVYKGVELVNMRMPAAICLNKGSWQTRYFNYNMHRFSVANYVIHS